jgi:hypothetical protein
VVKVDAIAAANAKGLSTSTNLPCFPYMKISYGSFKYSVEMMDTPRDCAPTKTVYNPCNLEDNTEATARPYQDIDLERIFSYYSCSN